VIVYARKSDLSELLGNLSAGGTAPFVGRTRELGVADRGLSKPLDGRGGVLQVAGDAGIGNTSLV